MSNARNIEAKPITEWQALRFQQDENGYRVSEPVARRCVCSGATSSSSRQVALSLFLASALSWLVAPAGDAAVTMAYGAAAAILSGAGLSLLALSMQLIARNVRADFDARHLCLESCAGSGKGRLLHVVPFETIESLYLRRPDHGTHATLFLLPRNGASEIAVIRGPHSEMEGLHRKLSRDIAHVMAEREQIVIPMPQRVVRPRRVVRRARQQGLVAEAIGAGA